MKAGKAAHDIPWIQIINLFHFLHDLPLMNDLQVALEQVLKLREVVWETRKPLLCSRHKKHHISNNFNNISKNTFHFLKNLTTGVILDGFTVTSTNLVLRCELQFYEHCSNLTWTVCRFSLDTDYPDSSQKQCQSYKIQAVFSLKNRLLSSRIMVDTTAPTGLNFPSDITSLYGDSH